MTLQSFLEMGGYAWYVWPSYGITFVVLLINVLWPIVQRKQFFRQLWLKQKRGQQR
ncbi:heme exporter protein CcmD [Methylomonas sp. MED-D]|uniref:heme exporter protein CcmD n=1 Tax=unclassified Methylomonas TaxID=2608980 RepID=UPI00143C7A03|nr:MULTISPECIES: heme exporter protein CcmD [unclassified Methylomonas]MDT4328403.1 heme exporter protein CcmD [Methylomonas sp. MV1]NJA06409.1 heme exporter protein CcmD [Methylococcaceae bacterium WWC4]WGS88298.1 heme exporter protein CcmD [Methylomonas sp. UP202]